MRQCGLTVSDEDGKLIFYTNCHEIANAEHEQMANGDSLNFDYYLNSLGYDAGSWVVQGSVVLPDPADNNIYHLLHVNVGDYDDLYTIGTHLLSTKIDMSKDGGKGEVVEKNSVVLEDMVLPGGLTATRHANGRDWWLVVFKYNQPWYYRILLTPQGVINLGLAEMDVSFKKADGGPIAFAPDGSKLAVVAASPYDQGEQPLYLFDFDRCTGLLSNSKKIQYSNLLLSWGGFFRNYSYGCTFSPNSRYLYISDRTNYFQLDMWSDAPESTMINFADNDGFWDLWGPDYLHTFDPFTHHAWSFFGFSGLSPDGRIYTTTVGLTRYFHVIERPNNPGISCKMEQHSFKVLGINQYSFPNHPNYRLGPLEGSGCDTLGIQKAVYVHAHPYPEEGCVGGEVHFEVTAFGTGRSYQWQYSTDGGSTWANITDGPHFAGAHTEYLVVKDILESYDGMQFRCTVTGNASTETSRPAALSVIGYLPTAAFSFVQDIDSLHFFNESQDYEYVQYFYGDGNSSSLPNANHLYLAPGTYTVTLVATNACGQDTATAEIVVEPLFADLVASRTVGCKPFEVTFTSRSPYRALTHQFTVNGATPNYQGGRLRTMTVTYGTLGTFDVKLKVFGPNNEVAEILLEDYITVLAGTNPVADIAAAQDGATVALGCPSCLADTYTWHFPNGDTLGGQSAEYTFSQSGYYQVVLEAANQCGTAFDTAAFTVGSPDVAFSAEKTSGCAPFAAQYHNWTQYAGATLEWHFPGGQPTTSSEESPLVVYENAGQYDATLIVAAGGLTDTLTQANYIEVLADECPEPQVFAQINELEVTVWTDCQDGSAAYLWDMGNGATFDTDGATYQYPAPGTYGITLTVAGPCGTATATVEVKVDGPSGIGSGAPSPGSLRLVPNPASGTVYLLSERAYGEGAAFRLFNPLGGEVLQIGKHYWGQREQLGLGNLPPGVYFYQFDAQSGLGQVGRLVVE
ncbi:MAG: PKD domain-containing protein [Saprospiraceae bacterium]